MLHGRDSLQVNEVNNSEADDDESEELSKHVVHPKSSKRLRISLRPEDSSLEIAAYPQSSSTKQQARIRKDSGRDGEPMASSSALNCLIYSG